MAEGVGFRSSPWGGCARTAPRAAGVGASRCWRGAALVCVRSLRAAAGVRAVGVRSRVLLLALRLCVCTSRVAKDPVRGAPGSHA
jgi:hypothetical protein